MSNIEILGVSEDSIAVIFDLLEEVEQITSFKLYPNIICDTIPYLPNKSVNYEIMSIADLPASTSKVFFGCATPKVKKAIFDYFNRKNQISNKHYLKLIHPSSYIAASAIIENGVLIEPQVVVSAQSSIGFGVYIKRGCMIGHHNVIGEFTDINPGVISSGKVKIGRGCTIGSGAVIRDNISIGDFVTIGVGSVVTKDIPANCIAYGNPCKVIKRIE